MLHPILTQQRQPVASNPPHPAPKNRVDAVVIGRNEGVRLQACIASLQPQVGRVIYVDSGSTDGSADMARGMGAQVVALDMAQPFTAARARNAGLALVTAPFVQFVDGDCTVQPAWVQTALDFADAHPAAAVICGRRRERHPNASIYNALCDAEWDTPIGQTRACGGDALMRVADLRSVGGYTPYLIAGEEPELCLRLARTGVQIWRIDAEMTLHDAAITRIDQWWQRSRRAGHAYAEGAALHGRGPERHWVTQTRRALIWGAGVPLAALILSALHPAGLAVLLAWPLQILRLTPRIGLAPAFFSVLGKLPEAQGAIGFYTQRLRRKQTGLIEYK
ncbi:Glycosyltransferase, catalytic subunit of cellulose synthase and poly-beta-1,6-N-acetylglucosamine synthase [Pseudorhodobacter antarcticus]|uniref:Glycosyltransferase, catalytic subunit of cellulose synthase and poly-beta-1,6-N-acetylglucosamine synthase n=1 Tax=Pseudorhodobacter antarcticus TaxID=1077947 RepID=A0A1H8FL81_9RHOB|nr:Glycosyltransferase, catalytic subunit of cellulose synthase and poly-beta-1,6-N-acetylglucosamine synthase [Pseudorhodobacter antarcticus]